MVVVAACGDERRLRAVPRLLLEAEDAAVEVERPLEIGDLQVDVADVDARIDAHPATVASTSGFASAARKTESKAGGEPHREGEPVDADHVGLHAERQNRGERRGEPGFATPQADEERQAPEDERDDPGDARVHSELRVGRLARA